MSPVSKAQQGHVNKYIKKNYDRTLVTTKKGQKERIRAAAQAQGVSVNKFIVTAIEERLDDLYCEKLLDDYLANNDPDKEETVTIEELAESLGVTL